MFGHRGLLLVGCAVVMCVTPVAADEDVYDGPTAIKPLTVTPQPQHTAPPNAVCDFEHQCYSTKGGTAVPAPAAPPVVANKPPSSEANATPDDPLVTAWRGCMAQALQNYEQSRDLHGLQVTTMDCQAQLEGHDDASFAEMEPRADIEPRAPLVVHPQAGGRRNIGCGWWPVGSDADRDCAAGGHHF